MPRSPLARLAALLFALTGATAAPISGMAHEVAHAREVAGAGRSDHRASVDAGAAERDEASAHAAATVGSRDSSGDDHPHAFVDAAVSARGIAPLFAVASRRVDVPVATERSVSVVRPHGVVRAGPDPTDCAFPRLRAPPAFPG